MEFQYFLIVLVENTSFLFQIKTYNTSTYIEYFFMSHIHIISSQSQNSYYILIIQFAEKDIMVNICQLLHVIGTSYKVCIVHEDSSWKH